MRQKIEESRNSTSGTNVAGVLSRGKICLVRALEYYGQTLKSHSISLHSTLHFMRFITILLKPEKDPTSCASNGPASVPNLDEKILSMALEKRLLNKHSVISHLSNALYPTQSGLI